MKMIFRIASASLCFGALLLIAGCCNRQLPVYDLSTLPLLDGTETRSISAENPTGEKGMGGMTDPTQTLESRASNARSADSLGVGWKVRPFIAVQPGETATLMDVDGSGVIQHIWMVDGCNRNHVLRFYWDNESEPSIEVPVPDFFAVGHEMVGQINSDVMVVNPANGMNCFWPMPFRKHAKITFTNEGEKELRLLGYQITYALTKVPKNAGYLHAQWRKGNTRDQNPFVILDGVQGKGRYAGTFLAYTQMTDTNWWGEGEIKFFIDGDKDFPTYCGTGTEDYFLGTYGFPQRFSGMYAGSVLSDKDSDPLPNYWSLYRWHTRDPIAFHKDLKITLQALGWSRHSSHYRKMNDDIASVAYWYQTEPHASFPPLPPISQRKRITEVPE